MRKTGFQITTGLLFVISSASATIIRVPQDQPTIQARIDAAVNGDTVLVAPGNYSLNINFNGKAILVRSGVGPDGTQISAVVTNIPIVRFPPGTYSPTLDGFEITGATDNPAILVEGGSPTIVYNILQGNTFFAIKIVGRFTNLSKNTFTGNTPWTI